MPKSNCPHIITISLSYSEILSKKNSKPSCENCQSKTPNQWFCLFERCGFVGCGSRCHDHIELHSNTTSHPLAINLHNNKIYCHICKCQVFESDNVPHFKLSQSTQSLTSKSSPFISMDNFGTNSFVPGLIGLKNFGNTCYINASLQALMNCPQLQYILFDGPKIASIENRVNLTANFQFLLQEVWSHQTSNKTRYFTSIIGNNFKCLYPHFRSFIQQDAQEFIRHFIDRLHEEIKLPINAEASGQMGTTISLHCNENFSYNSNFKISNGVGSSFKPSINIDKNLSYFSFISDIFRGVLCNTCECLECGYTSKSIESFYDLSLSIPICSTNPNVMLSPRHTDHASQSWWIWLKSWFVSPKVYFKDCLESYFAEVLLLRENQYQCEKCKKLCNGNKRYELMELPEILCIHLKRFRHEFSISSKILNQVVFPLVGLDVSQFMGIYNTGSHNKPVCTTYDLCSVICHWGSGGSSGHYTVYALNHFNQQWYEFDDETVTMCEANFVASRASQAYILFYKKKNEKMDTLRENACALESRHIVQKNDTPIFIDRLWMDKFKSFAQPGSISNSKLLCSKHSKILPRLRDQIQDHLIPISLELWNFFIDKFGGGPIINSLEICSICEKIEIDLQTRRDEEYTFVVKNMKYSNINQSRYAISRSWFAKWENFVSGKCGTHPTPIDNSSICKPLAHPKFLSDSESCHHEIIRGSEYCTIPASVWHYLFKIYSGGPEVILLYVAPPSKETAMQRGDQSAGP